MTNCLFLKSNDVLEVHKNNMYIHQGDTQLTAFFVIERRQQQCSVEAALSSS